MPVTTGTTTGTSAGGGSIGGGGGGGVGRPYTSMTAAENLSMNGVNRAVQGGLGLTTGKTIYGNTAFGPAGGMAQGYATMGAHGAANPNYGMQPTIQNYGNFRNLNGSPMFGGSPIQGQSFPGYGAQQSLSQAQRAYAAWQAAQRARAAQHQQWGGRPGGLLSDDPVVSTPLPPAWDPPVPEEVIPGYQAQYDYDPRFKLEGPYPGNPLNISGIQGGGGIQSYVTNRVPGYSGAYGSHYGDTGMRGGYGHTGLAGGKGAW